MKSDTPETHTRGRLRVDPDDRPDMNWNNHIVSVDKPHYTICFMTHDGTKENLEGEANARRLVACWNACEGIDTSHLEEWQDFGGLRRVIRDRDELERQRDEAVECLREVLDLIEGYEDVADGSDGPRPNDAMHAGNAIRAVLSKYPKP